MTMPAVVMALEAMRQPDIVRRQLRRPLPTDIIDLIKCAAGDRGTIERITVERSITEPVLVEASKFYLRHIVGSGGNDNYRTLALPETASKDDVREHRRWLLKWLHPDRNPSKWEATLFLKVETAANVLAASEPQGATVIAFTRTPKNKRRMRPASPYLPAPQFMHRESDQSFERARKLLVFSCLVISIVSLLLFGFLEWYPVR
jgi:DnaJ domain